MGHIEAINAFIAAQQEVERAARQCLPATLAWRRLTAAYLAMQHASEVHFLTEYEKAAAEHEARIASEEASR